MTVGPRANQRVNLIKEQDTWSAGSGLVKQLWGVVVLHVTGWNRRVDELFPGVKTVPVLKPSPSLRHRVSRGQHHWQRGRHNRMRWPQPEQLSFLHIPEVHTAAHHGAGADPSEQTPRDISWATLHSLIWGIVKKKINKIKRMIVLCFSKSILHFPIKAVFLLYTLPVAALFWPRPDLLSAPRRQGRVLSCPGCSANRTGAPTSVPAGSVSYLWSALLNPVE